MKKELIEGDVLNWIRKATFLKVGYSYLAHHGYDIAQVFSMPNDNPFRSDYDDGGGPYRLETIQIEYQYQPVFDKVRVLLSLGFDIRHVPGCRNSGFERECMDILFDKVPRIEDKAVEEYSRKVRMDDLSMKIQEEVKRLELTQVDVATVFNKYLDDGNVK